MNTGTMYARTDEDTHVHIGELPEAPMAREHYNHALALVGEYRELMNKHNRTAEDRERMGELHTRLIITQMCYNVSRWDDPHTEVPPEIQLPELPPLRMQPMEQCVARAWRTSQADPVPVSVTIAYGSPRLLITARPAAVELSSDV